MSAIVGTPLWFIYYRVQNREEAEDITQETFVRTLIYCRRHNTQPENITAFMKMVALNIIRDSWRQKQRQGKLIDLEDIKPLETVAADEQKAIAERMQVENALNRLKPEHKAVLDLRIMKATAWRRQHKCWEKAKQQCASCSTGHCRCWRKCWMRTTKPGGMKRWMTQRIFFPNILTL